ncbi:MAG TPA: CRTAC1 family protein [Terriglobales bacterium]|nr:CRTAC1 family protein [Terriglobales bacterium]
MKHRLQSQCMRVGLFIILLIAFSGFIFAQSAAQVSVNPAGKNSSIHTEKKSPEPKSTAPVPIFRDISSQAGLTASHISSAEKHYVIESMSGGIGLFDCDNDGKLDIVMVNGSTVDRYKQGGDLLVTLWHQDADLKFTDITEKAGLTRKGWGMGVAVADFDNDGNLDLFVTGYGGNALYRNNGNCTFEDVTDKAGVRGGGFSTGAAWADYDRDGNVDLFVSRYVHVDMNDLPVFGSTKFCQFKGAPVQCGPWGMEGETDLLYHNRGDGTFEEVSKKAGVNDPEKYYGLGVTWGDYDNDGWPDLFVADDATPNHLYHNNHDGTFTDDAMVGGIAMNSEGQALGSMGVTWGDYDHSGYLSMFITEFADQPNTLYHNLGPRGFEDVAMQSHLGQPSLPLVGWGTTFFDMDNDGWPDLFVANGHVYPQMDTVKGSAAYAEPMLLHRNLRNGTFEEVSKAAGIADMPLKSRRGAAFGDIANNGNIDIVALNVGESPSLLLNTIKSPNHRVLFHLVGTKSNRAAIGARVTVQAGGMTQFDEVHGGSSYLSQNDLRLHFGLGPATKIDSIEVRWPTGKTDRFKNMAADKIYTIVEEQGIKDSAPFNDLSALLP